MEGVGDNAVVEELSQDTLRPIAKGESFEGGMPILTTNDSLQFAKKVGELYGGEGSASGKWGTVYFSGEKATKIFRQPTHIFSSYEVEFAKKFGGVAGMPKFLGVVPNGYQMERFNGEPLSDLVNQAFREKSPDEAPSVWRSILTEEQVQNLLNKVVEFHKGTGRVHGDLGHWDDIIVCSDGGVRVTDPEWERIGSQTPGGELKSLHDFFTGMGYKAALPETITDEEAWQNLEKFKQEVKGKIEMDPVSKKVVNFVDQEVEVKVSEDGNILIKGVEKVFSLD